MSAIGLLLFSSCNMVACCCCWCSGSAAGLELEGSESFAIESCDLIAEPHVPTQSAHVVYCICSFRHDSTEHCTVDVSERRQYSTASHWSQVGTRKSRSASAPKILHNTTQHYSISISNWIHYEKWGNRKRGAALYCVRGARRTRRGAALRAEQLVLPTVPVPLTETSPVLTLIHSLSTRTVLTSNSIPYISHCNDFEYLKFSWYYAVLWRPNVDFTNAV